MPGGTGFRVKAVKTCRFDSGTWDSLLWSTVTRRRRWKLNRGVLCELSGGGKHGNHGRSVSRLFIKEVATMLVLSRKPGEVILVADVVEITVVEIRGDKVKIGITAPADINIDRLEVWKAKQRKQASQEETK